MNNNLATIKKFYIIRIFMITSANGGTSILIINTYIIIISIRIQLTSTIFLTIDSQRCIIANTNTTLCIQCRPVT